MSLSWEDREWLTSEMRFVHHRLDNLFRIMRTLVEMDEILMTDLSDVQAAVTENATVDQSAIALINGLADKIDSMATDPAALAQLSADLRASSTDLAAAVSANTPAETPPPA